MNYVEGDDAATILYHLCDKRPEIQKPYAVYNSGFDWLLGIMDFDTENQFRSFSIGISFVFGYLTFCFSAIFIDLVFHKNTRNEKYIFLALLPFILPDFIFHSLLLNSSNISFAFALMSLICYMLFFTKQKWHYFFLSVICIAVAIPFRWSMVTIFPMFFSLLLLYKEKNLFFRIKITVLHNAIALTLAILFLHVTGYDLNSVINTMLWGRNLIENIELSILSILATASAFFTIPFVILILMGLFVIFTTKRKYLLQNILFGLITMLPFFILGFAPAFKFLLALVPMLLMLALIGFLYLADYKIMQNTFFAILTGCWFIGIQIDATGTAAGPGFEQSITKEKLGNSPITDKNLDGRIKIKKILPAFGSGFYMPMLEGPRPLYGYFYVIFGGGWKKNIQEFTEDRNTITNLLKEKKFIYLQDRISAYYQCDLYRNGYKTDTPFIENGNIEYRDFIKKNDTIRISSISNKISKVDYALKFINENDNVIFRSAYSSMILNLAGQAENIEFIGPYTIKKSK